MQVTGRLMRELSWVMCKNHTRRKSQRELKWNTAQQVARIKHIWRASRQPQLETACVLLQEEDEWSWTSIPNPKLAFKSHSGWISPISDVTGTPAELLPRLSPSSHHPFLLAYCFPVNLLTVLRPPRCNFNRSKKRFLGAVLIVFTIFCFLPIDSCQLEV